MKQIILPLSVDATSLPMVANKRIIDIRQELTQTLISAGFDELADKVQAAATTTGITLLLTDEEYQQLFLALQRRPLWRMGIKYITRNIE